MSKNTFSVGDGERSGLSCHTLAKRQNGVFCLGIAILLSDRLLINGSPYWVPVSAGTWYGPDWARTSDPALIKRML